MKEPQMTLRYTFALCALAPFIAACTDSLSSEDALRSHGYSEVYIAGYHDGCQSGKRAGGDSFSQRARDEAAYASGSDYKTGWDYAFVTCRDQEVRDLAVASAIGAGLAGGVSSHGADGIDAREMLKGMDTSAIQAAGW
jgi:hypothetical protein